MSYSNRALLQPCDVFLDAVGYAVGATEYVLPDAIPQLVKDIDNAGGITKYLGDFIRDAFGEYARLA